MAKLSFLSLFLLFPFLIFAQSKKQNPILELADRHFNNCEFYLASIEYKRVLKRQDSDHAYATYKLAESCRMYFDLKEAVNNYKKIVSLYEAEYPDARFKYANVLKEMKKYSEALEQYKIVVENMKLCSEADFECKSNGLKAQRSADYCTAVIAQDKQYGIPDHDFLQLRTGRNMDIFRFSAQSNLYITNWEENCGLAYLSVWNGSNMISCRIQKDSLIGNSSNTGLVESVDMEGTGSFTADTLKVYFGRTDMKNDRMQTEIYVRKKVNGKWQKEKLLNGNINFESFSSSHPEISKDGRTLYFVSDRPGGMGKTDIWYSTCDGEDNWSKPVNMGSGINTKGNETSRIYETKRGKVLTFSSDGRKGPGDGFDIYIVREDKGWKAPEALPSPYNSKYDDCCFVLDENDAYLSSNRAGAYEVYTFKWKEGNVHKIIYEKVMGE